MSNRQFLAGAFVPILVLLYTAAGLADPPASDDPSLKAVTVVGFAKTEPGQKGRDLHLGGDWGWTDEVCTSPIPIKIFVTGFTGESTDAGRTYIWWNSSSTAGSEKGGRGPGTLVVALKDPWELAVAATIEIKSNYQRVTVQGYGYPVTPPSTNPVTLSCTPV